MKTGLQALVTKYEFAEEVSQEESKSGELHSFDRIVHFEGGDQNPRNIKAAKEICRECLRKGKPYAKRSKWSKRIKYMYIIEGFKEAKNKSWKITKTGDAADTVPIETTPPPKEPKPVTPKKDKTTLEKALQAAKGDSPFQPNAKYVFVEPHTIGTKQTNRRDSEFKTES